MSILTEMTDEMCRVYGSGWGGFRPDDGTKASIVLGSYEGKPAIVVIGCVDGVWGAEATDERGDLLMAVYEMSENEALKKVVEIGLIDEPANN